MAGNLEFNANLDIFGSIQLTTVPNQIGTVLTYNDVTRQIGFRTNSELLNDLGLYNYALRDGSNMSGITWNGFTAQYATYWNEYDGTQLASSIIYGMVYDDTVNKWRPTNAVGFRSFLGITNSVLNPTLQNVTDNGNTTTNPLIVGNTSYTGGSIFQNTDFAFLTHSGSALKILIGGLLVSDNYNDTSDVPTNGIYAKGNINSNASLNGQRVASRSTFVLENDDSLYKSIAWQTNGNLRWYLTTDPNQESGGNSGSPLSLYRYADDGSYLGQVFTMNRSNGVIIFSDNITTNTHYGSAEWALAYERSNSWNPNPTWQDVLNNGATATTKPIFNVGGGLQFDLKSTSSVGNNYFSFKNNSNIETHNVGLGASTNNHFYFYTPDDNFWLFFSNGVEIQRIGSGNIQFYKDLIVQSSNIYTTNYGSADLWYQAYQTTQNLNSNFISSKYLNIRSINDTTTVNNVGVDFYYVNQGAVGKPIGSVDGALLTMNYSDIWSVQLYGDWRTNRWWGKNQNGGVWGEDVEFWTTGNLSQNKVDGFFEHEYTGSINNGSDPRTNQSWFDYSYAGVLGAGVVASFDGLGSDYRLEIFGQYGNGGNIFAVRSRNGDTGLWNTARLLWHDGNLIDPATQTWVNQQGFLTSASIGNGTLTLATSSDLTGSATFLANQSTNNTFTVGLASATLTKINNGSTAFSWGNHNSMGYLTSSALNGYATQLWVQSQGYLTSANLDNYVTTNTQQIISVKKQWTTTQSEFNVASFRHLRNVASYANNAGNQPATNYYIINIGNPLTATMWEAEIEFYNFSGATSLNVAETRSMVFKVTGYNISSGSALLNKSISQLSGDSTLMESISYFRDSNNNIVVGLKLSSSGNYPKVYLKRLTLHHVPSDAIENAIYNNANITMSTDISALTLIETVPNSSFIKQADTSLLLNNYIKGSGSASNPQNYNFAIGYDGTDNFIQSHSSKNLKLNPLGNDVHIGSHRFLGNAITASNGGAKLVYDILENYGSPLQLSANGNLPVQIKNEGNVIINTDNDDVIINRRTTINGFIYQVGNAANSNTTKIYLQNNSGLTWALSSGINNISENLFSIGTWTSGSYDWKIALHDSGLIESKIHGSSENWYQGYLNSQNALNLNLQQVTDNGRYTTQGLDTGGYSSANFELALGYNSDAYYFKRTSQTNDVRSNNQTPMVFSYHTGVSLSAHDAYQGTRIWAQVNGSPYQHDGFLIAQFVSSGTHIYTGLNVSGQIVTANDGNSAQWNAAYQATQNLSTNYVPYNGAINDVDLNGMPLKNLSTLNLNSGGRLDGQGNLRVRQNFAGGNATGMFWQNQAQSENISGIGTLTTSGDLNYMYMGWGNFPWDGSTAFIVSETNLNWKNKRILTTDDLGSISDIYVKKVGDTMSGTLNIFSGGQFLIMRGSSLTSNYSTYLKYDGSKDIAYVGADGGSAGGGGIGDNFVVRATSNLILASDNGLIQTDSHLWATAFRVRQTGGFGAGISLYDDTPVNPDYGIMFATSSNYGSIGVTSDWNTYFTMTGGLGRGWIFRHKSVGNVLGISGEGRVSTYYDLGSQEWAYSYNYGVMSKGDAFVSNTDANNISFGSIIVANEMGNGTGNINFPSGSNLNYGTFVRHQSRTFTTDWFGGNDGDMWFKTWYNSSGAGTYSWRKIWDSTNLPETEINKLINLNPNPTWDNVLANSPNYATNLTPIFYGANPYKLILRSRGTVGDNYFSFQDVNGAETAYQGFGSGSNEDYTFLLRNNGSNKFQWFMDGWLMTASSTDIIMHRNLSVVSGASIYTGNHGHAGNWYDAWSWGNHREYGMAGHQQYLGGNYVGGGLEKPNYFGSGKLKLQMLNAGSNIGASGWDWSDVLWMSSYAGSDVKLSTAIISNKYDQRIGFAKQDFDAPNWGTLYEFITTSNLGNGLDWDGDKLNVIGGGSGVSSIAPAYNPSIQLMGDVLIGVSGNAGIGVSPASKLITIDVPAYSGGTGILVSGNTVSQQVTTSGSGNAVTSISQTTNGFQINYGTISASYTLPPATASILGGIKVGSNLSVLSDGTLSAVNTTYSAGNGLTLSGTQFSLPVTISGTGNTIVGLTTNTNGLTATAGNRVSAVALTTTGVTGMSVTGSNSYTVTTSGTFQLTLDTGYRLVNQADSDLLARLDRFGKVASYTTSSTAVVNTSANDGLVEYKRVFNSGLPCALVTVRTDNPRIGDKIVVQGTQCDVTIRGLFSAYTLKTTRGNVTSYNHVQSCLSNGVCIFEFVYCDDGTWLMTNADCWGQF